jgi:hypothetical protein
VRERHVVSCFSCWIPLINFGWHKGESITPSSWDNCIAQHLLTLGYHSHINKIGPILRSGNRVPFKFNDPLQRARWWPRSTARHFHRNTERTIDPSVKRRRKHVLLKSIEYANSGPLLKQFRLFSHHSSFPGNNVSACLSLSHAYHPLVVYS